MKNKYTTYVFEMYQIVKVDSHRAKDSNLDTF